jgi:hypothetical protein
MTTCEIEARRWGLKTAAMPRPRRGGAARGGGQPAMVVRCRSAVAASARMKVGENGFGSLS